MEKLMDNKQSQALIDSIKKLADNIESQSYSTQGSKSSVFGRKKRRDEPERTPDKQGKRDSILKKHSIYLKDMSGYLRAINRTTDKEEKARLQVLKAQKQTEDIFDKISENTKTAYKELEALPGVFENVLKKSGLDAGMFGSLKGLEDIEKITGTMDSFERSAEHLENMNDKQREKLKNTAKNLEKLNKHLVKSGESFKGFENLEEMIPKPAVRMEFKKAFDLYGNSLNDLYLSASKTTDGFKILSEKPNSAIPMFREKVEKLSKVIDRVSKSVGGNTFQRARGIVSGDRKGSKAVGAKSLAVKALPMLAKAGVLGVIGGVISKVVTENLPKWVDEKREIGRYGAHDLNEGVMGLGLEQTAMNATELGMNPQEMAKMIGENKQIYVRMKMNGENYIETLKDTTDQLQVMGVPLTESTIANSRNIDYIHGLGVAAIDTTDELKEQNKQFQAFRKFGFATPEEYQNFRDSIIQSGEVQELMASVGEDERIALEANITKMAEYGKTLGFTNEQTKALATRFAKMAKEAPMDRMQKAAKIIMMAGHLGTMNSEEQNRYMQISMGGARNTDDMKFREDMNLRTGQALVEAYRKPGGLAIEQAAKSQGIHQELMPGVEAYEMGKGRALTPAQVKKEQEDQIKKEQENSGMARAIGIWDGVQQTMNTSVGLAGALYALAHNRNVLLQDTYDYISKSLVGDLTKGIISFFKGDGTGGPRGENAYQENENIGTANSPSTTQADVDRIRERNERNSRENLKNEAREAKRKRDRVNQPDQWAPKGGGISMTGDQSGIGILEDHAAQQVALTQDMKKIQEGQLRSAETLAYSTSEIAKTGRDAQTSGRILDFRTNAGLTTAPA